MRWPAARCSVMRLPRSLRREQSAVAVVIGPDRPDVAAEVEALLPLGARIRPGRAARHGTCGARGACGTGRGAMTIFCPRCSFAVRRWFAPRRLVCRYGLRLPMARRLLRLGFEAADPTGYGRLVMRDGVLESHRRAQGCERGRAEAIRFCNAGLMALDGRHAPAILNFDRQFERSERILSDRRSGACSRQRLERWPHSVRLKARCRGRQRPRPARCCGSRIPAPQAPGGDEGGRDADCAPRPCSSAHVRRSAAYVLIEPNVVFGPGVTIAEAG